MGERLFGLRRARALLRSRWSVFAALGLTAGLLVLTGMRIQADAGPSLEPLLGPSTGGPEELTVWVLFQRLDCASSRWKIEAFGALTADEGVRVVGMALDSPDGWPDGIDPVDRLDVPYEVLEGPSPVVSRGLRALGVAATPAALVVDRVGRLRHVIPGEAIRSPEELQKAVRDVLSIDG